MHIVIGGVERNVSQVDTFCLYGSHEGLTTGEILEKSRSERLSKKILQKKISEKVIKMSTGQIQFMEVPTLTLIDPKELTDKSVDKAREIELSYAMQARDISEL